MTDEFLQSLLQNSPHLFRVSEQIHFFHQLQIAERHRGANWVTGIRKAMGKVSQFSGSIRKRCTCIPATTQR